MYARAVLKSMLGMTACSRLPAPLVPADRIVQRWAVAIGYGLYAPEAWDAAKQSKPPPLDDDTAIVVDQIILKSPAKTRKFVQRWYKTPLPLQVLAEEFGMSERSAVQCWHLCLHFLDYRFRESGNKTLLGILRIEGLDEDRNLEYQSMRELENCR